ncbi:serine hydrolase [Paenibacillus sp. OV219]|uniref:serine hydrolase domain-containing protein n=1 Tax=Paenibacillus sp. OV219 TaxID=1884377 RepID=UPI0008D4FC04|nr:serine hydrolase domain-containing protein [Paenibacillus sp. OV219]SEO80444.1 CubicO group peptidase, beta-lactamase class C family [Paenibacillus sp. OV219]
MSDLALIRSIDELHRTDSLFGTFNGSILIAKEHDILVSRSYGMADFASGRQHDEDTLFYIASITKQFTAACILLLVQEHRIALTDPIGEYIPQYEKGSHVTIFELLTHTSGIPEHVSLPEFWDNLDAITTPEQLFMYFKDMDLESVPGTAYKYCNSNYILLGMLIEAVSGQSYGEFLSKHIFAPLGMNRTFYAPMVMDSPNKALGYAALQPQPVPARVLAPVIPFAAGGIQSTTADLFKWSTALFEGNLLPEEALRVLLTPHLHGYGLGVYIEEQTINGTTQTIVYHDGGIDGYCSKLVRMLATGHTVILLSNYDQVSVTKYYQAILRCMQL